MPVRQVSMDTGLQEVALRLAPGAPLAHGTPARAGQQNPRTKGRLPLPPRGQGSSESCGGAGPRGGRGSRRATRVSSSGPEKSRQMPPALAPASPARQPTEGHAWHAAPGPRPLAAKPTVPASTHAPRAPHPSRRSPQNPGRPGSQSGLRLQRGPPPARRRAGPRVLSATQGEAGWAAGARAALGVTDGLTPRPPGPLPRGTLTSPVRTRSPALRPGLSCCSLPRASPWGPVRVHCAPGPRLGSWQLAPTARATVVPLLLLSMQGAPCCLEKNIHLFFNSASLFSLQILHRAPVYQEVKTLGLWKVPSLDSSSPKAPDPLTCFPASEASLCQVCDTGEPIFYDREGRTDHSGDSPHAARAAEAGAGGGRHAHARWPVPCDSRAGRREGLGDKAPGQRCPGSGPRCGGTRSCSSEGGGDNARHRRRHGALRLRSVPAQRALSPGPTGLRPCSHSERGHSPAGPPPGPQP